MGDAERPACPPPTLPGFRSRIAFALVAFSALGVLTGLGFWQLGRAAWKNGLLAKIERSIDAPAIDYSPPAVSTQGAAREFMRVRIEGEETGFRVKLFAATPDFARDAAREGFGAYIFSAIRLASGVTVFVNRGFAPDSVANALMAQRETRPETLTGLVRVSLGPTPFSPAAQPEKRMFYSPDIGAMAASAGVEAQNPILTEYVEVADGGGYANPWPRPRNPRALLDAIPNSHMQYAVTWFGLAAGLAGVLGFYALRRL